MPSLFMLVLACLMVEAPVSCFLHNRPENSIDHFPFQTTDVQPLQSNNAVSEENSRDACSWNKKDATCGVSVKASIDLLHKSNDSFARFISYYMECQAITNKKRCRSKPRCIWDDVCVLNLTAGHEDSPCLADAPAFTAVLYKDCSPYRTYNACRAHPPCDWFIDEGCSVSFVSAYINITVEEDYLAREMIEDALPVLAFKEFGEITPELDFDRVMEWEIPEVPEEDCKAIYSEAACSVEFAYVAETMPGFYYCTLKYEEEENCTADPVCMFDKEYQECWRTDLVSDQTVRFEAMLPYVKYKTDREIVEMMANCSAILNETLCEGDCIWDSWDASCSPRNSWVHEVLSSSASNTTTDPVCKFLQTLTETDCGDMNEKADCLQADHCVWRAKNCEVAADYLIEAATEGNPKLKKAYDRLQRRCSKKSQKKCIAS